MNFRSAALLFFLHTTLLLVNPTLYAQEKRRGGDPIETDTTRVLKEVIVRPYLTPQPLVRSTSSIGYIDQQILSLQPSTSLVPAMNTIAGVRMEERSPGSYRLSIRGSLLRSPFGVRNVKIYFDDFPLTDAGGNTYLNALDVAGASQLQVLKGPNSSIYGANSGGVVLIDPQAAEAVPYKLTLKAEGGSYGTFRQNLGYHWTSEKYSLNITQAYQRSDGYRDHSGMNRKYIQALQTLDYRPNARLKALLFYSDLHYNTPGGLTTAQFEADPKAARPAAGPNPGAIDQQAGIYSKTGYAGLSNSWQINSHFKHVFAVYASYTDFRNPFITNYEKRKESTIGMRSYIEYHQQNGRADWRLHIGIESMETRTDFDNFDNNRGTPGQVQAADDLKASANFIFANLSIDLFKKLLMELSASANLSKYTYKSIEPVEIPSSENTFDPQFMPRAALSYLVSRSLSIRASVSKGYSPPTLSEVRSSNNIINTRLQPEHGWNYESGIRYETSGQRLVVDINGFYYGLRQAITRRIDESDAEYFVNTGRTRQLGLESSAAYRPIIQKTQGLFQSLQLRMAYTLSHFKFRDYIDLSNDYTGNSLTGVPKAVIVSSADIQFPKNYRLFVQHNYTSSIPLNDANTVFAKKYHLLQAKISKTFFIGLAPVEFYAGADNLLNQQYSLGNDLNAFGGRYFNAAALRNFYGGLAVSF